jgi:phosphoglycerate dehydrogenase-like enzyme
MTLTVGLYGLGRFGTFFAKYLKDYGFNLSITDINNKSCLEENEFIKNQFFLTIIYVLS